MYMAPKNGTVIEAEIPGYGYRLIRWQEGFMNDKEEDCGGWVIADDMEEPECWHGGACWASNADENQSIQPVRWRPSIQLVSQG